MIEIINASKYRLTEKFLYSISDHLSSRSDCSKLNYSVTIGHNMIYFEPPIQVCPSTHVRKRQARESIVEHVILRHFHATLYNGSDEFGNMQIHKDALVPGVYIYESSIDNKRRRWHRVRSL